jgi:hypothetical protein
MNNVDRSIKYLSGEMSLTEAGSFEKELLSDNVLKEQFDEVSAAYELIKEQLQKRDDEAFRNRLLEVMEQREATGLPPSNRRSRRSIWYVLLPFAASLAILLALFFTNRDSDRMFSKYYNPDQDPVVLAYSHQTRGETSSGIIQYQNGQYRECMEIMENLSDREPENLLVALYYLLASMEIDLQDQALEKLITRTVNNKTQLEQSISWYTSLALIKSGRGKEAVEILLPLTEEQGPYRTDAIRLQKMLLK